MLSNKRREELLSDKAHLYLDDEDDIAEIQMTNLANANKNGPNYMKLDDSGTFWSYSAELSGHFYRKNQTVHKIHANFQQITYTDKPIVPTTSYNFQPKQIQINGLKFVHKDAIKGVMKKEHKAKQPEMEVTCQACVTPQSVPANTHSFVCFDCECVQACTPQFGIFICGNCQRKVWYPLGSSDFIKCGKCWTINKIPSQQSYFAKPNFNHQENQFLQKQLQSQNVQEKFFSMRHPM